MRVGILGGGLLGCCAALALAERGIDVAVLDQNQSLLSRAATANEGKIHLGYMYAADPTFATARVMMTGALAFAPFMHRYAGISIERIKTSFAANYVVHRDSQHSAEAVIAYLTGVHRLVIEAASGRESAYFGLDLSMPLRSWRLSEREAMFNPQRVLAAFETPEVAIDPEALAVELRACIAGHPRIEVRFGQRVLRAARDEHGISVVSERADGQVIDRFDHVVNALWEGRLAVDGTMGYKPDRPWLHRLKYGIVLTLPQGLQSPPSITVVSGPFGEVVTHPDRRVYLTWYPECLQGISADVAPPRWPKQAPEPARSRILRGTVSALSDILPCLDPLNRASLADADVKGGVIVAWGSTDIVDPNSELHHRYEIGITSAGHYHSIDPGKLTLAPYFAEQCADRICGTA
ncbi:MAG: FAD-dependent oxidoreductase [Pseudolabrys sp.]